MYVGLLYFVTELILTVTAQCVIVSLLNLAFGYRNTTNVVVVVVVVVKPFKTTSSDIKSDKIYTNSTYEMHCKTVLLW